MFSIGDLPLKNIKAHRGRAAVLLLALLQAVCLLGGLIIRGGLSEDMALAKDRLGADVLVYPGQAFSKISAKTLIMQGTPVEIYRPVSSLDRLSQCEEIGEISLQLYITYEDENGKSTVITGYDPETDFAVSPWISEGREIKPGEGEAVIGCNVQEKDGTIEIYGKKLYVAGHLERTGSLLDDGVFVSMPGLGGIIDAAAEQGVGRYAGIDPYTQYSAALIRTEDKESAVRVCDWINLYVRKVKAVRSEEPLSDTSSGIRSQMGMTAAITAAVWVLLLAGQAAAVFMLVRERSKEIFVMLTSGASEGLVSRLFIKEILMLLLTGAAAGAAFTIIFFLIKDGTGIMPAALLYAAAAVAAICAAGLLSALAAVRMAVKKSGPQMLTV